MPSAFTRFAARMRAEQVKRPHAVRDRGHAREVEDPRIGGGAADDELGPDLAGLRGRSSVAEVRRELEDVYSLVVRAMSGADEQAGRCQHSGKGERAEGQRGPAAVAVGRVAASAIAMPSALARQA